MRRTSRSIDALGWPWLLLLGLAIAAIACAHVPPLVPLVVLVVPPAPHRYDIGHWRDEDLVCVAVLPMQAVYVTRRCLAMAAIRALILGARVADDPAGR